MKENAMKSVPNSSDKPATKRGTRAFYFGIACVLFFAATSFADTNASFYQAQYWKDKNVARFIPHVALTATSFVGADAEPYRAKSGLAAGILADLGRESNLVLETGVLYREAGAVSDSTIRPTNVFLRYVSVPAAMKYYFNGSQNTSAFLKLGVLPSILVGRDITVPLVAAAPTAHLDTYTFDIGAFAGFGSKFMITESADFSIEGVYSRSFTGLAANQELFNTGLQISAGLGLAL
jgi:hypothetical protein